jgi:sugar phosphate isomerase/epimerase
MVAIASTLERVRAIGYQAVQVSGIPSYDEKELKQILDGEGLVCAATHEPGHRILDEPEKVAEHLHLLGCRDTAFPHPGERSLATLEDVLDLAADLNRAGQVLHEAGLRLSYHNHQVEFRRLGGRTVLEILYAETDPRYLLAELDTYWVQYGGGDPVAWCKAMTGRMPVLHVKDYGINDEHKIAYREVGNGNLDWPAIIAAGDAAGVAYYAVEQDTCPGDAFDSVRQSFEFMRDNLCS